MPPRSPVRDIWGAALPRHLPLATRGASGVAALLKTHLLAGLRDILTGRGIGEEVYLASLERTLHGVPVYLGDVTKG